MFFMSPMTGQNEHISFSDTQSIYDDFITMIYLHFLKTEQG